MKSLTAFIRVVICSFAISTALVNEGFTQQVATVRAIAGPKGIWVICGDQLPKSFSYRISRQKNDGEWSRVADVILPASKEDLQAALLNTQRASGIGIKPLTPTRLDALWQRITPVINSSSPPEIQDDFPLRSATGTVWYDAGADSAVNYKYKVQVIRNDAPQNELITKSISYPGKKFGTQIKPISVNPTRAGLSAEFEVVNKGQMTGCKIYRSYYLRSGYEELNVMPIFTTRKGVLFILFTDYTAVPKVPYTYVVLPFDAVGNAGELSPELRAYNVPDKSISPSVVHFNAYSMEINKAIRLSWQLKDDPKNITSIDIYKCIKYNGQYTKIASVSPRDTSYVDTHVQPVVTYYYTIKLNGVYETSPTSPRLPAILRASNKNLFPPQKLKLIQNGNKVTLTWQRTEDDTRAYYIYRATGRYGKPQQIGSAIISDSLKLTYTEKLPDVVTATVFAYSVADENTSYAISPRSHPVFAYAASALPLPIPYNIAVNKIGNHKLQIIWPDMHNQSTAIQGYMIYRRSKTLTGNETAIAQLSKGVIPFRINQFVDSTVTEGSIYYYSLRTVGLDGKTFSGPSLESGQTIYEDIPANVSNVKVFTSGTVVELRWNNPVGQNTQFVKIYRSLQGKPAQLIATVTPDKEAYSDKDLQPGGIYYYTFNLQDSKGKVSSITDPVGIHLQ